MRSPKPKPYNRLLPEEFGVILPFLYHGAFEGRRFEKAPDGCPKCDGPVKPYDWVKRVYVRILELNGEPRNLYVKVRRFKCPEGHITLATDAFYPDCRYGKRIVDLVLFLGASQPFNSVEKRLSEFRIQVDRDTVRKYFQRFGERAAQLAGIEVLGENQAINVLKLLFGLENIEELKEQYPDLNNLDSQADETYPSKKGSLKKYRLELARCRREGGPPSQYPEAFTVAMSLIPSIDVVPSLVVHPTSICDVQGTALKAPLRGSNYILTDGSGLYARWSNRVPDLFHESRNRFKRFREALPNGQSLDGGSMDRFKEEYGLHRSRRIEELSRRYPEYLDENGDFKGPVGAGAVEGLNSRLHYFLGVPYKSISSIIGRIVALLMMETQYTFRRGRPLESFAHSEGEFTWEKVMDAPRMKKDKPFPEYRHWDLKKKRWYIG